MLLSSGKTVSINFYDRGDDFITQVMQHDDITVDKNSYNSNNYNIKAQSD